MRVARAHQNHEERRQVVIDLLDFIHDFNKLDTTLLVDKALADFKFVEAAEAVLQAAVGPWKSVDALRDFCVQALYGEKRPNIAERTRPGRVTPFSVPYELLRAVAPNPSQFHPHKLRTLNKPQTLEIPPQGTDWFGLQVPQDQWWLVTTVWARAVPHRVGLNRVDIEFEDAASGRYVHNGKLWALLEEPMPSFWPLVRNSFLRCTLRNWHHIEEPVGLLIVVEGWCYQPE